MLPIRPRILFWILPVLILSACTHRHHGRDTLDFTADWRFILGDDSTAFSNAYDDSQWRTLDLPHDWSIEGPFSADYPATAGGGALPGGIGWYRKTFDLPSSDSTRQISIEFDGIYRNSEVWLNEQYLGKRPNGYVSFRYDLTPHLRFDAPNVLAVRVDNSEQPNSRWYSGSGIYRNVRLVKTDAVHVDHWGTFITTPEVSPQEAQVRVETVIRNRDGRSHQVRLQTVVFDARGRERGDVSIELRVPADSALTVSQDLAVSNPRLWSVEDPALYRAVSRLHDGGRLVDEYETRFGIRTFSFHPEEGFSLNGQRMKILGVCNHHDLGALGAAVNRRAIERQLEIMKAMGVNAIRTAHNPPAPELLELADEMGFLVMDEAFDMWRRGKSPFDYSQYWDEWHVRDLQDFVRRDRNHPSVFMWSIGNEILEQWDSSGVAIARELAGIVRELDPTRPITTGNNDPSPWNSLIRSGALDVIGYNYNHAAWEDFPERFPGETFLATETTSALATRGAYDMPSDSVRIWPVQWDIPVEGNPDFTCSSYDNCRVGWGSTHEEAWRIIRRHDFMSGLFIWTGFDYLGEPTPYDWPARSSYFGIVDLAGFPKNAYYMYQSEWTDTPVLHVFPHWNWSPGDTVDVWVYTNADEVELFLNDVSLGTRTKGPEDLHLAWRVPYEPGSVRAVGRSASGDSLEAIATTAGPPARIELVPDRSRIRADGKDLSFLTVNVLDADGNLVPHADNLIQFEISDNLTIAGVDNGSQTSHEPFKSDRRHAFNGKALAIVQAGRAPGTARVRATAEGLEPASVSLTLE